MKIFFNHCFDKRRFSQFIYWFFKTRKTLAPHYETIVFLEKLKSLGFQAAMKAGFSISIEDLETPDSKSSFLFKAEKSLTSEHLTVIEYLQSIIEVWNRTSELLKKEVIESFQLSDFFNPVYVMAFSGARGNISQIRQLVAMRGLMTDPLGQVIDFPIRSNFREGLTLTEYLISCSGARKGIVDTALRTASSGYLTRRLVDVAHHVIISQIDCQTKQSIFLEDLYDIKKSKKKLISLNHRLVGRILAKTIKDDNNSIVGYKNQEISKSLTKKLCQLNSKIFIRSPLTCESPQFICQFCYGWSLAEGQLVSIGEAVGILAAQSIGEPGTQLTMRTFHTGGVFTGTLIDEISSPYNGFIYYPFRYIGLLVRTKQGQIAFLSKNSIILEIFSSNKDKKRLNFPSLTLLYAHQGQYIEKNQLLAETAPIAENLKNFGDEKYIFSPYSGELYCTNLTCIEQDISDFSDKIKIIQNISEFWILFGHLFLPCNWRYGFRFKKLDLVNKQAAFFQIQIVSNFINILNKKTTNLTFRTKFQEFNVNFIFFKKIAYFHHDFKNIQTWMAGIHFQSKYNYQFSKIISVYNFAFSSNLPRGGVFNKNIYEFQKTYPFFYENLCIVNLNRQNEHLLHFSSCFFIKKNIQWSKLTIYSTFLKIYRYCFNIWKTKKIQSFCLPVFSWQKVTLYEKYYFLLIFFKKFNINSLKTQNQLNKNILYNKFIKSNFFIKLGFNCFLRIQISNLGFIPIFYDKHIKIKFNSSFEEFFMQSILDLFFINKATKKQATKKQATKKQATKKQAAKKQATKKQAAKKQAAKKQAAKKQAAKKIKIYSTQKPSIFNSYFFNNKFKYSFKIQKRIINFYFNSFFYILKKFYFIKNFNIRYNQPIPKKLIIIDKFKYFFWKKIYSYNKNLNRREKFEEIYYPLLNKQRKFIVNLNSISPIQNKIKIPFSKEKNKLNSQNLKFTVEEFKLIKQFKNNKLIQRTIFKYSQPQFFIRFFVPIELGEVVDFINLKCQKQNIMINSFDHFSCYKTNLFFENQKFFLGDFLNNKLLSNKLIVQPGQFIAQTKNFFLIRNAKTFRLNSQNIFHGNHTELIYQNQHICTSFYTKLKTDDIIQGIPKIEQIFESRRRLKYKFSGMVEFFRSSFYFENKIFIYLTSIQKSILNNIQRIYCGQGIHIADKHIEIIVRQITSNVLILDPGESGLLIGEIVPFQWIFRLNSSTIDHKIVYEPLLMGMTRTCLKTSSFISAASFQETTRVLSQAAMENKIDFLRGLKQNIIIGRRIPAGTGFYF